MLGALVTIYFPTFAGTDTNIVEPMPICFNSCPQSMWFLQLLQKPLQINNVAKKVIVL